MNKIMGVVTTALISRTLLENYGGFLSYQMIFSYLLVFSLFSSDYMFLIKYKTTNNYLQSDSFYQIYGLKIIFVFAVLLFGMILVPKSLVFILWPYFISIALSLFLFDFVLYIEGDKIGLIKFRFISQFVTLLLAGIFYLKYLPFLYITILQPFQTAILTLGTFFVAKKYISLPPIYSFLKRVVLKFSQIKFRTIKELFSYFIVKNFLTYIVSIEVIISFYFNLNHTRDIFAEGLRLTTILAPFVVFYINFNMNTLKRTFFKAILFLGILLLLFSPLYLLVFGEYFLKNIFLYNFFIISFMFSSFLENDTIFLLTENKKFQYKLTVTNGLFFVVYSLIFILIIFLFSFSLEALIFISLLKYFIYYIFFGINFKTYFKNLHIIGSFLIIISVNIFLKYSSYYTIMNSWTIKSLRWIENFI